MLNFKLYYTDASGHVTKRIDLDCESEEQALAAAREHAVHARIELWNGAARVETFDIRSEA